MERKEKGPPRRGRPPSEPLGNCIVCGKQVGRPKATLCLECVRKAEQSRRPRFPGGARTEHGTRVARAVTCVRCGKQDHVAFKPRDPDKVMCKACTLEVTGRDEHGDLREPGVVDITCQNCGRTDRIPRARAKKLLAPDNPEPILCSDCDHGILSVQGDRTRTGERRRSGVILKRKGV
ncbi:MAG: hypothetical protein HY904_07700 [Deltaproteobacteria bacterium]|nr:hypothetical protein [Deltaproteobacteria bacterium]